MARDQKDARLHHFYEVWHDDKAKRLLVDYKLRALLRVSAPL